MGVPPALPGRQQKFDISGSRLRAPEIRLIVEGHHSFDAGPREPGTGMRDCEISRRSANGSADVFELLSAAGRDDLSPFRCDLGEDARGHVLSCLLPL